MQAKLFLYTGRLLVRPYTCFCWGKTFSISDKDKPTFITQEDETSFTFRTSLLYMADVVHVQHVMWKTADRHDGGINEGTAWWNG